MDIMYHYLLCHWYNLDFMLIMFLNKFIVIE